MKTNKCDNRCRVKCKCYILKNNNQVLAAVAKYIY